MAPHRINRECLKGVHTTATNIHFKCTKAQEKISGTDLRANSSTVADCSQKPLRRHTENFKNLLDNVVQQLSEVPLQEQLFDSQKALIKMLRNCCGIFLCPAVSSSTSLPCQHTGMETESGFASVLIKGKCTVSS